MAAHIKFNKTANTFYKQYLREKQYDEVTGEEYIETEIEDIQDQRTHYRSFYELFWIQWLSRIIYSFKEILA